MARLLQIAITIAALGANSDSRQQSQEQAEGENG